MARAILFTDDDLVIGGTGEVIGTSEGAEVVTVVYGQISLDASFNRGGDTVILPGISSDYFGHVVGSRFVITKGDYSLSIPLGVEGITIQFDNVSKTLIIDEESGTVLLADQDFTQIVEQIDPAEPSAPTALDDAAVLDTSEAGFLLGNVLDNDSDPQGDELVVAGVEGEAENVGHELEGQFGTLIIEADGNYRYTADPDALAELGEGESATDTFTYVVSDGNGGTDQADLVITVEGTNEAPETGIISVASIEDGPVRIVDGLANAHDPEGSTLTVIPPDELPDGVTFDEKTGEFALNPSADAFQELGKGDTQTLRINYQVSDGTTTTAARIIWQISGRNDAADFDGDTRGTVREDVDATDSGRLTVTDVDAGQDAFDPASDGQRAGEYGTFNFDSDTGKWRYILDNSNPAVQALDDGETLTDLLRVSSLDGSVQTIRITIQGTNDAPVARADSYAVAEDGTLNVPAAAGVLANDTDVDGEPLSAALVAGPAHGALTLNPDGSFSYTPDNNYVGPDSFTYQASDGTGQSTVAKVTLNVGGANDAPVAPATNTVITDEDTASTAVLIEASDVDGDGLTYSVKDGGTPAKGSVSFNQENGTFTYTPDADAEGSDSFTIVIGDGHGGTAEQVVSVTINPVNDTPELVAEIADASIDEDALYSYDASVNFADPDAGDQLSYSATGLPAGLTINQSTGVISGTPGNGVVGEHTITVTATGEDDETVSEDYVLTVVNTNDAPVASEIADRTATEGTQFDYDVSSHFADDDLIHSDQLTYSATGLPSGFTINPSTGVISGMPDGEDVGEYSVTVTATDTADATASDTFALTVGDDETPPTVILTASPAYASEGSTVTITIQFSEAVSGFTVEDLEVGGRNQGELVPDSFTKIDDDTYTVEYVRTAKGNNPMEVSIDAGRYTDIALNSGEGGSVEVRRDAPNNVNDAPEVIDEIADGSATEDALYSYDTSVNFTDPDVGAQLSYTASGLPTGLSINASTGVISGTPTVPGSYDITVTASDGSASVSSTYELTINNVNDAPVLSSEIADGSATEDALYSYDTSVNFTDPDVGAQLSYTASGLPTGLSINASTGVISGTPTVPGSYDITVTASDGSASVSSTYELTINNVNDAPVLSSEIADGSATEDALYSYDTSVNFTDPDVGAQLSYTASGLPTGLSINASTGVISGTPTVPGSYDITVTASDGSASVSSTYELTINNVNDAPVLSSEIADGSATEDALYSYDTSVNFTDPDVGAQLSYTASGLPTGLSINASTGVISGTPTVPGSYDITVTASDGQLNAADQFQLTVESATNDALWTFNFGTERYDSQDTITFHLYGLNGVQVDGTYIVPNNNAAREATTVAAAVANAISQKLDSLDDSNPLSLAQVSVNLAGQITISGADGIWAGGTADNSDVSVIVNNGNGNGTKVNTVTNTFTGGAAAEMMQSVASHEMDTHAAQFEWTTSMLELPLSFPHFDIQVQSL